MSDALLTTAFLGAMTFATRYLGVLLGQNLPRTGSWARALNALPGTLIVSLVAVLLVDASPIEWVGASVALAVAFVTRSLPMTMLAGIVVVWVLRSYS